MPSHADAAEGRSDPPDVAPLPRPGLLDRLNGTQRTCVAVGLLFLAFALPLYGQLRNQGPPMEEGFMLVFPEMVMEGLVPNKDFLHLYGPGSLWVLAGVFEVFGVSLTAERLVGLAQHVGLVFGVFAIARLWGRTTGLLCAGIALLLIVPPTGLTALAWVGAVALGLWAVRLGLRSRHAVDERWAGRAALAAGLLAGASLLYRPDLVLALALASIALVRGMASARVKRLAVGLIVGVSPYLVHLAMAGIGPAFDGMVLDPVFRLRGGRRLAIPPPPDELQGFLQKAGDLEPLGWPIPMLSSAAQITTWFFLLLASVAALIVVGVVLVRSDPASPRARTVLVVAAFSLGLLPQALQRPDTAHLAWVSCVPMSFLPIAGAELLRRRHVLDHRRRGLLAGGVVLAALVLTIPVFTVRSYVQLVAETLGYHRLSYPIVHEGRTFYYGRPDVAAALPELLDDVEEITEPGDRLFVGTSDLRKTPYNDSFIYYLLPDLEVATYYVEMDPGVANREGSGLAEDVASADIVVLTSVWDDWDEPNDSRLVGSDEPNEVLREQFCSVDTYGGLYELLRRCR